MVAAKAFHGNPYDGHRLAMTMDQLTRVTGRLPEYAFVDLGYRGHDYSGECEVVVGKRRRGRTPRRLWRWMRRRAAIEPAIGHLKEDRRMNRNRLKGREGDAVNVSLSGAAMNFRKLLGALLHLLLTWYRAAQWLLRARIGLRATGWLNDRFSGSTTLPEADFRVEGGGKITSSQSPRLLP